MKLHLLDPLAFDVRKRLWGNHRKNNAEYVCLGEGKRSEPVVVFLACSIPKKIIVRRKTTKVESDRQDNNVFKTLSSLPES